MTVARFKQEEDRPSVLRPLLVAAVALVIFAAGVAAAWWSQRSAEQAAGRAAAPPREPGKVEIGMVNQLPFDLYIERATHRAAARRRLERYGWIDRRRGLVHIPIRRAIELVVEEGRR